MGEVSTDRLVHHRGRKVVQTLHIRRHLAETGVEHRNLTGYELATLLDYIRGLEDAAFGITVLSLLRTPAEAQGAPQGLRVRDPEGRRWVKNHHDYECWQRTDEGPLIHTSYSSGAMTYPLETYHASD